MHEVKYSFPQLIYFLSKLKWRLIWDELFISWLSESVWKQEYITFVYCENLSQSFMTLHFCKAISETVDSLIQRIFVYLRIIHDNINLRLKINILINLHNTISRKFDSVLHLFIHIAFIAY
jgi:hypothetical protein